MKMVDVNEEIEPKKKEELPIDFFPIKDLPSRFLLYPKGTKLFGRPLKVPEVKKLALLNENNFNEIINSVLQSSIKGLNIEDLIIADKLFLIFWLRANTYKDPGYVVKYYCEHCKKIAQYEFNLDNLTIEYLKDDYFQNKEIQLKSGNIIFGFQTVKEEMESNQFKEKNKDIDQEVFAIATIIKAINNEQNLSIEEKYQHICEKINPQEFIKMATIIKKYDIGINSEIAVKCNLCGGESRTGVSFRSEFFLPEYSA